MQPIHIPLLAAAEIAGHREVARFGITVEVRTGITCRLSAPPPQVKCGRLHRALSRRSSIAAAVALRHG